MADFLSRPIGDPLQYQKRIRFPTELEQQYRQHYAGRAVIMQRYVIALGFVVYGFFSVLDYYAMPRTHVLAWLLRAAVQPLAGLLFFGSYQPSYRKPMSWLINLWMFAMNLSILGMILASRPEELAFTFYPIGLMLVLICGYVASGDFWYASIQGWLAVIGYVLVGIFVQRMMARPADMLKFFTLNFFLLGMNCIGVILAYVLERTNRLAFLQELTISEQQRISDRLLLNVLPAPIAERLKRGEVVADHFDHVSVLFADIACFTTFAANQAPSEVVSVLNQMFSAFDRLTEKYNLEKIKTIGDAYMVVAGVPTPRPDQLEALANMALDMQAVMAELREHGQHDLQLRIGIHTGPALAGVIGLKKFSYDLWGDTVNVASRMESTGIPGQIQVTEDVYRGLHPRFVFQHRGGTFVRGKGVIMTYLLKGHKVNRHDSTTRLSEPGAPRKRSRSGVQSPGAAIQTPIAFVATETVEAAIQTAEGERA